MTTCAMIVFFTVGQHFGPVMWPPPIYMTLEEALRFVDDPLETEQYERAGYYPVVKPCFTEPHR